MRIAIPLFATVLLVYGCARSTVTVPSTALTYLLPQEPADAQDVIAARKSVKDGDEVVLIGRVGGERETILRGRAVFTLADRSLTPCNERQDDECPTPWDYCCEPPEVLKESTVLVKIVDNRGETVSMDLRQDLGLSELKTVVVRGRARRDAQGNFTLIADGMHIRERGAK